MAHSFDTAPGRRTVGAILVERGVVDADDLEAVLAGAAPDGPRIGSLCLELGLADERAVAGALAENLGHPCVVLADSVIDLAALELVPRVVALQHRLLPVAIDDERLTIAAADAFERDIFAHVAFASGRRVEPLLALDGALARAIPAAYDALARRERTYAGGDVEPGTNAVRLALARPDDEPPAAEAAGDGEDDDDFDIDDAGLEDFVEPAELLAADDADAADADAPLILVVDDDEDIRGLLQRLLRHDGYRVIQAGTGREAMEVLRRARPGVVLLDAMLPEVHGFEICRAIKESEALRGIPVVMVSAVYKGWENARDIQEVHRADAFVEKPFDVSYLRELVARMLGRTAPRPALEDALRKRIAEARTSAHVSYKMADFDDAMAAIERWRGLDPFDPDAYLLLGNVLTKRRDTAGAMHAYERAATFGPELFAAFKNLALTLEQLGFKSRAYASWYRAAELTPEPSLRDQIQRRLQERYRAFL